VRDFPQNRQEILEELVNCNLVFDIVFIPDADLHQDHGVIHWEARRAFKNKTIIAYEMAQNSHNFHPDVFIEIAEDDLYRKIAAVNKYKSQAGKKKRCINSDYFDAQAVFRGGQGDYDLAEGFKAIRIRL
jgi:LmbE family N-acetylglucosaminyl deacetylase